jgi:hypothetical protein
MRVAPIDHFVKSFVLYLQSQPLNEDIEKTIATANRFLDDPDMATRSDVDPQSAPVTRWLEQAMTATDEGADTTPALAQFCEMTKLVLPHCPWTPGYNEAEVGSEFKNHFAYATLVGDGGIIPCDYFSAGITLIAPNFFYDWHHHPVIEIYVNLTTHALWGTNKAPMEERALGAVITHPSYFSHAMFCEQAPLLAPWLWAGDVNVPAKMC